MLGYQIAHSHGRLLKMPTFCKIGMHPYQTCVGILNYGPMECSDIIYIRLQMPMQNCIYN